jgi:hypothetical protein
MRNLILYSLFQRTLTLFSTVLTLYLVIGIAEANRNFVKIHLLHGVSVELPKNWIVLTKNKRITLDSWVESKTETIGELLPSTDLGFAANYYDDSGKTAAIFNIRYYPEQSLAQTDSNAATETDIKELDDVIRTGMVTSMEKFGFRLLSWAGTKKQSINGIPAFITEYAREAHHSGNTFRVQLVRVLNAERSFTITLS